MNRYVLLILTALTSCTLASSSGEDLLKEYDSALQEARETLEAYATGVTSAADPDAVGILQISYVEDMQHAMDDVRHALGDIEGCEHEGMGASTVVDAMSDAASVEDALDALEAAHASHTDVSECLAEAGDHENTVESNLDTMAEHYDAWDGEMRCEMHDDDMMGHED